VRRGYSLGKIVLSFSLALSIFLSFVSCSDVSVSIYNVYPQLIYSYESKNASPAVCLSVFAEVNEGERIQSMTVKNTKTGMVWTVEPVDLLKDESLMKSFVGYSSLCMPGGLSFDDAVYQIVYEDKAGRTTDSLFTLKAVEAGNYGKAALSSRDVKYLLVGKKGNVLYSGPYDEFFLSTESLLQSYPDALYYREFVLNTELNSIYLLPAVYLDQGNQNNGN